MEALELVLLLHHLKVLLVHIQGPVEVMGVLAEPTDLIIHPITAAAAAALADILVMGEEAERVEETHAVEQQQVLVEAEAVEVPIVHEELVAVALVY
jgi:hypothetical protein